MIKTRNIIIILLLLVTTNSRGQHNTVFGNYFLHPSMINPGITGSEFFPVINATCYKQWAGINHSPSTQLLSGSFRIGNFDFYNPKMYVNKTNLQAYERIGAGILIYNDNEGPVAHRGGQMSYSFHIPFTNSRLSLGLSTGIYQDLLDESGFDPVIKNDPLIHYGSESYVRFNCGFGAYYYSSQYFAGISVTDMLPLDNKPFTDQKIAQDFHVLAGFFLDAGKDIKIEPSLYVGYLDYSSLYYQLNTKFYYKYVHWLNIHYKSSSDLGIKIGIKMSHFYIAYGYEASLSRVFLYNIGTHEIHLGTNLGIRRLEGY